MLIEIIIFIFHAFHEQTNLSKSLSNLFAQHETDLHRRERSFRKPTTLIKTRNQFSNYEINLNL